MFYVYPSRFVFIFSCIFIFIFMLIFIFIFISILFSISLSLTHSSSLNLTWITPPRRLFTHVPKKPGSHEVTTLYVKRHLVLPPDRSSTKHPTQCHTRKGHRFADPLSFRHHETHLCGTGCAPGDCPPDLRCAKETGTWCAASLRLTWPSSFFKGTPNIKIPAIKRTRSRHGAKQTNRVCG